MKLKQTLERFEKGLLTKHECRVVMHHENQSLFHYSEYLKDSKVQSIVIVEGAVYIVANGLKWILSKDDKSFIPNEFLNFSNVESSEKEVIDSLISKCKVVFDVGANIGWYTVNWGKLLNIEKIYSFEPIPHTFSYLQKHVAINGVNKAEIFNIGLSNEVGEKEFFWTEQETGSASMSNIRENPNANRTLLKLDTIDNFMKERDIKIDFIKCDVEGAELFVFKGGIETIKRDKPIVFSEMLRKWSAKFNYHPNDIIKLFTDIGYECYSIDRGQMNPFEIMTDEVTSTNFVFIHKDTK